CLCTIMAMDAQPYLQITGSADDVVEQRMVLFLRELRTFHRGLIFNGYERLRTDGFRWAPRSLLGQQMSNIGAIADQKTADLCQVGPFFGLPVQYPGFRFEFQNSVNLTAKHS